MVLWTRITFLSSKSLKITAILMDSFCIFEIIFIILKFFFKVVYVTPTLSSRSARTSFLESFSSVFWLLWTLFLFLSLHLFLLRMQNYREGERVSELPSSGSLSRWSQQPELGWSETRNQEFVLGLPRGCRNPSTTAILMLFSQVR